MCPTKIFVFSLKRKSRMPSLKKIQEAEEYLDSLPFEKQKVVTDVIVDLGGSGGTKMIVKWAEEVKRRLKAKESQKENHDES